MSSPVIHTARPAADRGTGMAAGVSAGLAAGGLWGLTFIVPAVSPDFGAVAISTARYVFYGGLSLLLLLMARAPIAALLRQHGIAVFLLAMSGSVVYYLMMTLAVQRIGAALTALIIGCLPITVPLTGAWRDPRLLLRIAPALLLIALGLAVKQMPALSGLAAAPDAFGLLCAVAALVLWNWYALANARYLARNPQIASRDWASLTGLCAALGAPLLLLLMPVTGERLPDVGPQAWAWFIGMAAVTGIGSAWAAAWLWNLASRRLPVALAGQLIVSETLFALLYAFLLEGRWPQTHEAAAMALVIGGVLLGLRRMQAA